MKVSIIVPIYNVASYMEACLESIARQTYSDLEVIFVDDCGTDNSMTLIRKYLSNHSFPVHSIITHERNRGLSAARNTGLKHATGDYVFFLDSDDEIVDNSIESLVEPLAKEQYDVVIGGYEELYENSETKEFPLAVARIANPLKAYADGTWYVMAWNKLCNRKFLLQNELYFKEGVLHEDVIWSFQLACKASLMCAIKDITYRYRIRSSSIMTSMSIEKDVNIYLRAFDEIRKFIIRQKMEYNADVYRMVEGKKCGILYSLLQKKEYALYAKYYPEFYKQCYLSPIRAFKSKIISLGYLLRDLHYCLPLPLAKFYKRFFYLMGYKWRGKRIEGAVWG